MPGKDGRRGVNDVTTVRLGDSDKPTILHRLYLLAIVVFSFHQREKMNYAESREEMARVTDNAGTRYLFDLH